MCNRFIQKGREVKPGQKATVMMRGPAGVYELPFEEAVFGGPARTESRNYWIKREGAAGCWCRGSSALQAASASGMASRRDALQFRAADDSGAAGLVLG